MGHQDHPKEREGATLFDFDIFSQSSLQVIENAQEIKQIGSSIKKL